jgi:hypothetical protein
MNDEINDTDNGLEPVFITYPIGGVEITAEYDDWELLFEMLESDFGIDAVEDDCDPDDLDIIDAEEYFDNDIGEN